VSHLPDTADGFSKRDNTLAENYEPHDIATESLRWRLWERGVVTAAHGTDDRHGEIRYGYGLDIACYDATRVHETGSLAGPDGYIEVKTKRASNNTGTWYGRLNERHLDEYQETATADTPVFIYMCVVDEDEGVVLREGCYDVRGVSIVSGASFYSKGNKTVKMSRSDELSLDQAVMVITQ